MYDPTTLTLTSRTHGAVLLKMILVNNKSRKNYGNIKKFTMSSIGEFNLRISLLFNIFFLEFHLKH